MIVSCDNDCENVCDDDASVPMSSREGHLVPMNTKAATTIQAVDKLTISETLFLEIFCNKKQTSDDLQFPNSELFSNHRKICECCPRHSLFKCHNVIVNIVFLNCQKRNQCLKCQVQVTIL